MPVTTKIATCNYCQTRVVVKLTAGMRFDLICSACGAPLEKAEFLQPPATPQNTPWPVPQGKTQDAAREPEPDRREVDRHADKHHDLKEKYRAEKERFKKELRKLNADQDKTSQPKRNKKDKKANQKRRKKRKGIGYWVREAIDEIEDLFD